MARKEKPTFDTEKKALPVRLRQLMDENNMSQSKLAEKLGVQRQTVSLYTTGQSNPDWEKVVQLCDIFHVSADYLTGLSDVRKNDATIKAVGDYTGLSEKSISFLNNINLISKGMRLSTTAKRDMDELEDEYNNFLLNGELEKWMAMYTSEVSQKLTKDEWENGFYEHYFEQEKRLIEDECATKSASTLDALNVIIENANAEEFFYYLSLYLFGDFRNKNDLCAVAVDENGRGADVLIKTELMQEVFMLHIQNMLRDLQDKKIRIVDWDIWSNDEEGDPDGNNPETR